MASRYSITLVVGAGVPGHATVQINGPEGTTYAGFGPTTAHSFWSKGKYDVITVPNGVSPVGRLDNPEYSWIDASKYHVKSYTFEVSKEQADAALNATREYEREYPKYNGVSETVCTDYALAILHAALPDTNLQGLSRIPSVLQRQLDLASEAGRVPFSYPVDGEKEDEILYWIDPHLPAFKADTNPPSFSLSAKPALSNSATSTFPKYGPRPLSGVSVSPPAADKRSELQDGPMPVSWSGPTSPASQPNADLGGLPGLLERFWGDDTNPMLPQPVSAPFASPVPSPARWPINREGQPDANVQPVRYLTRQIVGNARDGVWSPPIAPIPSQGPLTLKQAAQAWAASQYPQSAFGDPDAVDGTTPFNAAPPIQSTMQPWQTSSNPPADLGGWVTGLASVNPEQPDQSQRAPLDEWLDEYVRQNRA